MARQPAVVPMKVGYYAKYDSFEFRVFMFDPPRAVRCCRGLMWPPCPANQRAEAGRPRRGAPTIRSFPAGHGSIDRFLGARGILASSRSSAPPRLDGRPSFQRHRRPAGHGVHRSFSEVAEDQASRRPPMRNFVLSSGAVSRRRPDDASFGTGVQPSSRWTVAVGMRVTAHPPHGTLRARFGHRAPTSGE